MGESDFLHSSPGNLLTRPVELELLQSKTPNPKVKSMLQRGLAAATLGLVLQLALHLPFIGLLKEGPGLSLVFFVAFAL